MIHTESRRDTSETSYDKPDRRPGTCRGSDRWFITSTGHSFTPAEVGAGRACLDCPDLVGCAAETDRIPRQRLAGTIRAAVAYTRGRGGAVVAHPLGVCANPTCRRPFFARTDAQRSCTQQCGRILAKRAARPRRGCRVTLPLFPELTPTPVRAPKRAVTPERAARATYTPYRPVRPPKCDDCLAVLAETDGTGPVARLARWKRRHGKKDLFLCSAHVQVYRDREGLDPIEGGAR